MPRLLLLLGVLWALPTAAQQTADDCPTGTAESLLSVNDVRARILNNGGLFWRGDPFVYEVPKGSGEHSIFAASLWISGLVDGEARAAATTYGPWEFWPGDLNAVGNPPADCAPYDRIYTVSAADLAAYDATGRASDDLRDWPHRLGAPVRDGDGIAGNYDLAAGDRPDLIGHQMAWWVMNDAGGAHEATKSPPLNMEVQATAFAAQGDTHLGHATFYRYRLIYRGVEPLDSAYVSLFVDADLGNFDDDYIGSDTTLGLGFVYNADNDDEGHYGPAPPAVGVDVLAGPVADADELDNDRDGGVDEPGERLSMTTFAQYMGGGGPMGGPSVATEYHRYATGRWRDGRPMVESLWGFPDWESLDGTERTDPDADTTTFVFPGDPVAGSFWSERNSDGQGTPQPPFDKRFIVSTGPFSMQPSDTEEVVFAIVWARGDDHLDSVTELREASRTVQALWDGGFDVSAYEPPPLTAPMPLTPADGAIDQPTTLTLRWAPERQADGYELQYTTGEAFEDADGQLLPGIEVLRFDYRNGYRNPPVTEVALELEPATTYRWRLVTIFSAARSEPSPTQTFTTRAEALNLSYGFVHFTVVANAAGPLDPPEMAAFAFNSSGFPTFEEHDRPGDRQQVGEGKWGIHTGDNGSRLSYEAFISRSVLARTGWNDLIPYAFEIRFTDRCAASMASGAPGCFGWNAYTSGTTIPVPFELWRTGIGTPDDPSDDVRLIPYLIDWEEDGWGLRNADHSISGGDDDPETDWIYWRIPDDETPGEAGYGAWEAAARALPVDATTGLPTAASQDAFYGTLASGGADGEVIGRMVLVNWNGGNVCTDGDTAHGEPCGEWNQDLPEVGTVFRIVTQGAGSAPVPSAPSDFATIDTAAVTLWWTGGAERVQVARDAAFADVVTDDSLAFGTVTHTTRRLDGGATYYWRVRNHAGWSQPWAFALPVGVATEGASGLPEAFALGAPYPNPFNPRTSVRFAVPRPGPVRLAAYDVLGRRVAIIAEGARAAGWHTATWEAGAFASGLYVIRLEAPDHVEARTVVLVK